MYNSMLMSSVKKQCVVKYKGQFVSMLAFCKGNLTLIISDLSQGGGAPVYPRRTHTQRETPVDDSCRQNRQTLHRKSTNTEHKPRSIS